MLVTLWRHGEAGAAARDEDRALTPRGELTVAQAVLEFEQWRQQAGLAPVDRLYHSPLVRTRQTAQLLERGLGVAPESVAALAPGTNLQAPQSFLPETAEHCVLVSHQPFVSQAAWFWLDDDRVEPLLPGGWVTLELLVPSRGGGVLQRARANIF